MNESTAYVINDIHSLLNESRVSRIETPRTQDELRSTVTSAAEAGDTLSVAGGRHAMGGQQFLSGGVLLDTSGLNRVLSLDAERGLAQVEAGILWDGLVARLRDMQQGLPQRWSIVQKQTGADRLSIGGALSANGHGRGLSYAPIVQDVESLELVDAEGVLRHCSRTENTELFGLAVGGYGLFGAIYSATLRLMPAHYLRRCVEIAEIDDLAAKFSQHIAEGFTYGDFQYMTDETSPGFLRRGVLSCYLPVLEEGAEKVEPPRYLLTEEDWLRLLYLSHTDKARAFEEYAGFYQRNNGQTYDSDTFQLSMYIDGYHRELDRRLYDGNKCSETICELYVPLAELAGFMASAAGELRRRGSNVIYGTIRLIAQDDEDLPELGKAALRLYRVQPALPAHRIGHSAGGRRPAEPDRPCRRPGR